MNSYNDGYSNKSQIEQIVDRLLKKEPSNLPKRFKDRRGFTRVERKGHFFSVSHNGNMGNSVTHSVNPNMEMMKLPSIQELKEKYIVVSEEGSPDMMWSIIFDLTTKK